MTDNMISRKDALRGSYGQWGLFLSFHEEMLMGVITAAPTTESIGQVQCEKDSSIIVSFYGDVQGHFMLS